METKSRRLSFQQYALLKWMVGASMGLVAVSTVFNLDGYSHFPGIVATVCIFVSLLWPSGFARLPALLWRVYAIGIIPLMAMDVLAKDTVAALLNLNTWLIIYRALNHDKRREELQLVLLCLFILIMSGILTASLLFGIQMIVFFGLAIGFLLIGSVMEYSPSSEADFIDKRLWKWELIRSTLGTALRSRYLFAGFLVYSLLVGVSAMVFLVVPRVDVENKVTLFELKSNKSLSGFSENIRLGDVTDIKNDDSIALRVDVGAGTGIPINPYWRMLVLDQYSQGQFSLSHELQERLKNTQASPFNTSVYWGNSKTFAQVPSGADTDRWTVFVEPGVSRYLPVLGSFDHMTFSNLDKLFMAANIECFALKEVSSKMVSFQVEGVDFSGRFEDASLLKTPLYTEDGNDGGVAYPMSLLQLPSDEASRNVFHQASQSVSNGEALDALEFSRRAVAYLGNRHSYSMNVRLSDSGLNEISDPVAKWLQSVLDGHCEFFAASFVMMARSAGFPARVAVGYRGGEWNSYENYFMVSNADAHAWCEIYDGKGTWIRVDPTPGSIAVSGTRSMEEQSSTVGVTGSKAYLDSLRMLWYRRVVNYDEQAQREAALQMKDFLLAYIETAEQWITRTVDYFYNWIRQPWGFWRITYFSFLGLLLVVAFVIQNRLTLNYRELLLAVFRRGDPIRRKAGRILAKLDAVDKKEWDEVRNKILRDLQLLRYGPKERWPNARLTFKKSKQLS